MTAPWAVADEAFQCEDLAAALGVSGEVGARFEAYCCKHCHEFGSTDVLVWGGSTWRVCCNVANDAQEGFRNPRLL